MNYIKCYGLLDKASANVKKEKWFCIRVCCEVELTIARDSFLVYTTFGYCTNHKVLVVAGLRLWSFTTTIRSSNCPLFFVGQESNCPELT